MEQHFTPMIKQYLTIKEEYNDSLLFFRLGDFYELFFDDAVVASKELSITLTGRDGGIEERIPMCGVPYHAADNYIARLVDKGYKVAICEQVEDPKNAKGIVRREVIKIHTPGTFFSEKTFDNQYITSIYENHLSIGISMCDITTGELLLLNIDNNFESLIDVLNKYQPKELIYLEKSNPNLPLNNLDKYLSLTLTPIEIFTELSEKELNKKLTNQFLKESSHLSYELKNSLILLIEFLEKTQKQSLKHINDYQVIENKQYMHLDFNSIRNLELTETLRDKRKDGSLYGLLDETSTAMGSRLLKKWIVRPLFIKEKIIERQNIVEYLTNDHSLLKNLKDCLKNIYDLERLISKLSLKNINAKDLILIKNSLKQVPMIKNLLLTTNSHFMTNIAISLENFDHLVELIEKSIVDDPPTSINDGGIIKSGYNEELDYYREININGKEWLSSLEKKERELTNIKSLKVGYNKVFGYYIEVTKANLDLVPNRFTRKQTLANAERFITDELKEKESMILEAEEKIKQLEYDIFLNIRSIIEREIVSIQKLALQLATLDVYLSLAKVAIKYQYIKPIINLEGKIEIIQGRHPVIEKIETDIQFIPNDTILTNDKFIQIITGPNMAGKSTYMRQVALIIIMAQIGSFIPAKSANINLTDKIFTRIGASDDIIYKKSTFMNEMLETKIALQGATRNSLLLLDEIGRGTSTFDGIALAQAIIEYIHNHLFAKTLFSTHYHELTELEFFLEHVDNIYVKVIEKDGKIIFLHKIEKGKTNKSYGIYVAKLAGLPKEIIKRAQQKLIEYNNNNTYQLEFMEVDNNMNKNDNFDNSLYDILDEIKNLDIDNLTPKNAIQFLYKIKEKINKI